MCDKFTRRHDFQTHQIDFVLLPVIDGGDRLKHTVGVELGPNISVLKHESLANFIHLGFFEGSDLEGMLGRVVNPNVGEIVVTGNR